MELSLYSVDGRRVRTLVHDYREPGEYRTTWDGRDDAGVKLAPGAYIVRLEAGSIREARTIRLVR